MKNLKIRTDLALESADTGDNKLPEGVSCDETMVGKVKKTIVEIKTEGAAKRLKRPIGKYITLEGAFTNKDEMGKELEQAIKGFLPEGSVLVVGFGNLLITPDSIGPLTAQRIIATSHLSKQFKETFGLDNLREVSVVFPGSMGQTGLETTDFVKTMVNEYGFSAVVTIDALAARSSLRLGNTLQIASSGISPGSGVGNTRKECSESTMGVPVISVGVPTVTDAFTILTDYDEKAVPVGEKQNFLLTPKDIDEIVKKSVDVMAWGINMGLQPQYSHEEIEMLL